MNYSRLGLLACLLLLLTVFIPPCRAQQHEGFRDFATPQLRSDKLGAPEHLQELCGRRETDDSACGMRSCSRWKTTAS